MLRHVGKPIPLSNFLDFLLLKTFNNSASMKASTSPQIAPTIAPSTQSEIALSRAASTTTAAALYLSKIAGYSINDWS